MDDFPVRQRMAADGCLSIHPSGNRAARPPDSYAQAAKRGLKGIPGGSTAPGSRGPTGTPRQTNPFAVPRADTERTFRIYTRGNLLSEDEAVVTLEDQFGVTADRAQAHGSSHIDVVLPNEDDGKKLAHASLTLGGKKYRIGPTFHEKNVVAVILTNMADYKAERVREAFRNALGQGATYLAVTRGSSMQKKWPDFNDKVYLRMDPGVRMRDVVPRRVEVGGAYSYVYWYNAGPVCRHCGKGGHSADSCRDAPRQRGQGPPRPANRRAGRSPPTPTTPAATADQWGTRGNNNQNTSSSEAPAARTGNEPRAGRRGTATRTTPHARPEGEARDGSADSHDETPPTPTNARTEPENTGGETAERAHDENEKTALGATPENGAHEEGACEDRPWTEEETSATHDGERSAQQIAANDPALPVLAAEARAASRETDSHAHRGDGTLRSTTETGGEEPSADGETPATSDGEQPAQQTTTNNPRRVQTEPTRASANEGIKTRSMTRAQALEGTEKDPDPKPPTPAPAPTSPTTTIATASASTTRAAAQQRKAAHAPKSPPFSLGANPETSDEQSEQ